MAEEKNKWISMKDYTFGKIVTHEARCPVCGNKVTYHDDNLPSTCYICSTELEKPM